jgi:hypothetical protein
VKSMMRMSTFRWIGAAAVAGWMITALASATMERTAAGPAQEKPAAAAAKTPVLVELFTSEGCSSCPPADHMLGRLLEVQPVPGAEVIALGFHVDYWDHQGWVDRFGSRQATQRQNFYTPVWREEQIYTPQMVVNGSRQFVGHDARAAYDAIKAAAAEPMAAVTVASAAATDGRPALRIEVQPLDQLSSKADVWLAITEDNLVSDVTRGENARKRLPHMAVVRTFDRIGSAERTRGLSATRQVSVDKGWRRDALKAIVVVQDSKTRRVIGAAVASKL